MNTNKQLFIIVASGGSYDDTWTNTEFVTDDLERGQQYVDRMNAFRDEVNAALGTLNAWDYQYRVDHPRPILSTAAENKAPRWASGQVITQEMRDERRRIEEAINVARVKAMEPHRIWAEEFLAAHNAFKATFSKEIQSGLDLNYYDTWWEIEPVAWLT